MALCSLGAPLTPQSPLSLPGSLTGFLLRMCLKTFTILFSFVVLYELLLKKICFSQSYGLSFLARGYYDLKFSCQRLFCLLCFSRVWKDFYGGIMLG